jgi:regulator of sigma E protease
MFMGPALWKKQVGETLYSVRLIPLGGYCAMEGEDEGSDNPRAFGNAAWWKRLAILIAGAAMNFLVGVALMIIVYLPVQRVVVPVIDSFESFSTVNGPSGFREGDKILEVNDPKYACGGNQVSHNFTYQGIGEDGRHVAVDSEGKESVFTLAEDCVIYDIRNGGIRVSALQAGNKLTGYTDRNGKVRVMFIR